MKRAIIALFVIVGLACCVRSAQGAIITIAIEGVVDHVADPDNYLEARINIGDLITGSYTYDTDTPDSNPLSNVGIYEHHTYPYGFSLSVGGVNFMTNPANIYFLVEVGNDIYVDDYVVRSYDNLPLANGTSVNNISWSLQDSSATAITSIELPIMPPVLADWTVNYLNGGGGGRAGFAFLGHVTSVVVIPEPGTILLLGFGAIGFVRKVRR